MIFNLEQNIITIFEGVQEEAIQLRDCVTGLLRNDIQLLGKTTDFVREVNKYAENTDKKIDELKLKVSEVNINLILNGSVFVQGIGGMGSGTIIKKTNKGMYIITAYHVVVENAELSKSREDIGVTIGYPKRDYLDKIGGMILYGAKIIKVDEDNDLALLKTSCDDDNLNEIKIAEINPKIGDAVYSIGNPLGILRTVSKGVLCNIVEEFYISDNTVTYGNSGGGLFNKNGELIGVPVQVGIIYNLEGSLSPETSLGKSVKLCIIKEFLKGEF
jgi:S1-C subfamily serine protease